MMKEFSYKADDGQQIVAYKWQADGEVKGIVQIVHGVIEHAKRYSHFAEFLAKNGYAVVANDHRGHGKTARTPDDLGYFADKDGWKLLVADVHRLTQLAHEEWPEKPLILLGHSMGSFICRSFLPAHAGDISACILSGTAIHSLPLVISGSLLARVQAFFRGKRFRSKMLASLSFGAYNKKIKDPLTPYDWVSKDQEVVKAYMDDTLCGFLCCCGLFIDLMSGLNFINRKKSLEIANKELPMLIFSGSEDPVGNYGKGPTELHRRFQQAGMTNLSLKLYTGGRHEMLNEINREEVYDDVLKWIKSTVTN